ncbi:hypothetical protein OEZ86_013934 [Tetradesmus obliquus]|nr:hypothetical protein OEZ86_013934 [Tetradesmus obliquus]
MDEQQDENKLQQPEMQQESAAAAAAAVSDAAAAAAAAAADAGQVTSDSDANTDNAAASGQGGLLDRLPKLPQTLSEQAVREAQQGAMLQLTMQPDEDDFMMQVGALSSVCPGLAGAELAVSPRVSSHAAAESVKMLFMFQNLRRLQLRLDFDSIQISQDLVCAIAELMQLTSLQLLHGSIAPGLVLAHWSSLKQLAELTLLPAEQTGLGDAQLEQLPLLSATLTSLAIRPHPSLCPVGCGLSRGELQMLLGMPQLTQLTLGLKDAAEALLFGQLQLSQPTPRLCLAVLDGQPRLPPSELLSVLSWSLAQHLVKLAIGPLAAACPGDVLLMLATLKQLQELKLQLVAPLDTHSSGTIDLLALTPLRRLTCLELLASSRLYVPLNVKVISLASLAWPQLAALRLSLAGKPELMAESLALCDNFACLTELQLFSPVPPRASFEEEQLPAAVGAFQHYKLEECCVDDAAMAAILAAATGLRTLELAACEGLSNTALAGLTSLTRLTRLVIEAEATPGITLRAFDVVSCLTSLASLTWCSRDSLQGPMDCDALTGQLAALTRLRQLVLITGQQELLSSMCGWKVVLARALPLCRLVLWRELVQESPWGDEPQEGS